MKQRQTKCFATQGNPTLIHLNKVDRKYLGKPHKVRSLLQYKTADDGRCPQTGHISYVNIYAAGCWLIRDEH